MTGDDSYFRLATRLADKLFNVFRSSDVVHVLLISLIIADVQWRSQGAVEAIAPLYDWTATKTIVRSVVHTAELN